MTEKENPFAALLKGVQRHDPQWYGPHESGRYVLLDEVLAALAAAVPADLAEAGKVLEGMTLADLMRDPLYEAATTPPTGAAQVQSPCPNGATGDDCCGGYCSM